MNVETVLRSKGTQVHTTTSDASIATVVERLKLFGVGALVVCDDGEHVDGIVSERDVVRGLAAHGAALLEMRASELMTQLVATCRHDDEIAEIMSVMTARRIRHVPVVEDGRLAGMISIGDVVKSRLDEIEREAEALREYIARG